MWHPLVVDDIAWLGWLEHLVGSAPEFFEAWLDLAEHGLAARDLVEVRPNIVHIPLVLYLSDEAIDVQAPSVESVPLCPRGRR